MKRILLSFLVITIVASTAIGATYSYFSDTEKNSGNTFSTGTIDIAVDGQNPWGKTEPFHMTDMKPSQTDYIDFVVHNVGTNPVNLTKTLSNFSQKEITPSESKCEALHGTWDSGQKTCSVKSENSDLDTKINYDLRVELYKEQPDQAAAEIKPYWWETIYLDSDEVKLHSLNGVGMYLGMIPVGHYMKVIQSYHMPSSGEGDNLYQGEELKFDITLYAEQLTNKIALEDKYLSNTDVSHHVWNAGGVSNGKDALLEYGVKDKELNYKFKVQGMTDGTYSLVTWEDPTLVWSWGSFSGTTVLANVTVASNIADISGSINLKKDLINAKVWLVPGNLGAPGATGVTLPWDPTNTLFETGLMEYYDADKPL